MIRRRTSRPTTGSLVGKTTRASRDDPPDPFHLRCGAGLSSRPDDYYCYCYLHHGGGNFPVAISQVLLAAAAPITKLNLLNKFVLINFSQVHCADCRVIVARCCCCWWCWCARGRLSLHAAVKDAVPTHQLRNHCDFTLLFSFVAFVGLIALFIEFWGIIFIFQPVALDGLVVGQFTRLFCVVRSTKIGTLINEFFIINWTIIEFSEW